MITILLILLVTLMVTVMISLNDVSMEPEKIEPEEIDSSACNKGHIYNPQNGKFVCERCSIVSKDYIPCTKCSGTISSITDIKTHDVCEDPWENT